MINTNNLEIGCCYKSYKKLCEVLCEKVKAGEYKYIHLLEFESYFKFTDNFTITEIYEYPKKVLDKDFIKIFILKILLKSNKHSINLNKSMLQQELFKVINDKELYSYYKYGKNNNILSSDFEFVLKDNKNNIVLNKAIQALLIKSLKSLQSECLIRFNDINDYYSIIRINDECLKEEIDDLLYGYRKV